MHIWVSKRVRIIHFSQHATLLCEILELSPSSLRQSMSVRIFQLFKLLTNKAFSLNSISTQEHVSLVIFINVIFVAPKAVAIFSTGDNGAHG